MALDDDIRVLSRAGLFGDLEPDQVRLVAFGAESIRLAAGKDLFRAGQPTECAFVLVSGALDLVAPGADKKVLRQVLPGEVLGETALIAAGEWQQTAVARQPCELIRVNRAMFRRILEEYPEIAERLHDRFARALERLARDAARLQSRFS